MLLAVHLAILAHIAQWLAGGSTLTPVEPSEATDLAEHGRLNAGAIFFALAIGSTLLFGRWFCGWACHLVALQDGCRWILHRLGVRPRAIQLGVVGLTPLVAFVYMFLGPWLYRLWQGIQVEHHVALYTERFWATFPGALMTVATFLVCGPAIVWFLGSKGFCTYACPYGAVFGVADQLAPQRIRVTDACQGCGKCTVACSSNVRVHQEVRDFKAVVDPGCMKCLDCVSVCPTNALYVGFGAPALWTASRQKSKPAKTPASGGAARLALGAAFVFGLFVVLLSHQGRLDLGEQWRFVAAISAGTAAVAWIFRGKSTRAAGPSLLEEAWVGAWFLAALWALRGYRPFAAVAPALHERAPWTRSLGLDEGVPLLLSLGLAGVVSYGAWLALRLASRSEVSLQSVVLRQRGRVTRAGWVFAAVMAGTVALTAHGAAGRISSRSVATSAESAEELAKRSGAQIAFERGRDALSRGEFAAAEAALGEALEANAEHLEARLALAGVHFAQGRDAECRAELERVLLRAPANADALFLRGMLAARRGDLNSAESDWIAAVESAPAHPAAREALAALCEERGDEAGAAEHRRRARGDGTSRP